MSFRFDKCTERCHVGLGVVVPRQASRDRSGFLSGESSNVYIAIKSIEFSLRFSGHFKKSSSPKKNGFRSRLRTFLRAGSNLKSIQSRAAHRDWHWHTIPISDAVANYYKLELPRLNYGAGELLPARTRLPRPTHPPGPRSDSTRSITLESIRATWRREGLLPLASSALATQPGGHGHDFEFRVRASESGTPAT